MSCGVGHRHISDPVLLWLWCRPAAVTPIGPLAWEPAYAAGAALKKKKKKRKRKRLSREKNCQNKTKQNKTKLLSPQTPLPELYCEKCPKAERQVSSSLGSILSRVSHTLSVVQCLKLWPRAFVQAYHDLHPFIP